MRLNFSDFWRYKITDYKYKHYEKFLIDFVHGIFANAYNG